MRLLRAVFLTTLGLVAGCIGPSAPAATSENFLNATMNGQPFRASFVQAMINRDPQTGRSVFGLEAYDKCANSGTLTAMNLTAVRPDGAPFGVGEYSMARSFQVPSGPASITFLEMRAAIWEWDRGANYYYWDAPRAGDGSGSGTVTVTAVSSTHVEATFSFEAPPRSGNSIGGTRSVTNGSFRAVLRDGAVC